jgi:RimJ/RimL family protein N-acetyltransferase
MHYLGAFANREYGVLVARKGQRIIHFSVILPKHYHLPVLGENDLEIGGTWTAPDFRGKGLATYAIQKILVMWAKQRRRFWYVTRESNVASQRAAEKAGLRVLGVGKRIQTMGLGGITVMTDQLPS